MNEEKREFKPFNFFRGFISGIVFSAIVTIVTILLLWFLL